MLYCRLHLFVGRTHASLTVIAALNLILLCSLLRSAYHELLQR